jgi:restriction endonuclease S subunit
LKYLCKIINEKSSRKPDYVLALENIKSWTGEIVGNPYENKMDGDVNLFKKNDILFNKLRPYLAKVIKTQFEGGCVGELLVLRANNFLTPTFLYYRLISEAIITIVDNSTYGTKMPRASWEKFISLIGIGFPSIDEQNIITDYIENKNREIDQLISKTHEEIKLLNEYKTALISEVVTGKVDVRDEVLIRNL